MRALGLAPKAQRCQPTAEMVDRVLGASMSSVTAAAPLNATAAPHFNLPPMTSAAAAPAPAPAAGAAAPAPTAGGAAEAPPGAAAAADAALAAIKGGAHAADAAKKVGKVTVVEKRRFAGQDVEIAREVTAGTKQAEAAQRAVAAQHATTGMEAVLQNMKGAPRHYGCCVASCLMLEVCDSRGETQSMKSAPWNPRRCQASEA